MRAAGLCAHERRRFRSTTGSEHGMAIKDNLLAQRFAVPVLNSGRVTDITYLWTLEGWLYLAVILDLFSRRVVGWAISERLEPAVALEALKMALQEREPPLGPLHHSDRGSQYASHEYQQLLAAHGVLSSMSRKGNCWDNAVAESFFATLKLELVYQSHWRPHPGPQRSLRIHRVVLQSAAATFGPRLPCPNEFELRQQLATRSQMVTSTEVNQ
jgi:transposase InsO family protein